MKIKERKPIFSKVLMISSIVVLLNIGYLTYIIVKSPQKISGFSINENIFQSYNSLTFPVKIFMISQWIILLFILFYAAFRDKMIQKIKNENIDLHIQRNPDKNKTDLDVLYDILKDKKELPISAISKSFNVTKDIAMEWCKILESGELVSISYPGFSEPFVCINEKEIKNIGSEKSDTLKDSIKIKKEIEKSVQKQAIEKKEIKKIPKN